jgi:hypothetical protein
VGNGNLAGIRGALNLANLSGSDVVLIFDQADTTSASVTLDTLAGNVGQITGLSAPITFNNAQVSQLTLNLGPATSTVFVDATATNTFIFNSGSATVFVGTGTLTAIQGGLFLDNETAKDTVLIDDSEDPAAQTFNLITFPGNLISGPGIGNETGHTFGQVFGTALTGAIAWDNSDTSGMTLFGSNGGNVYNVFGTGVATTIDGGGNATINLGSGPVGAGTLANIQGALNLENLGSFSILNIFDQGDTSSASVTLDTLAGNVGQITGLSAPITFPNAEVSQLTLNLGPATSTVFVDAIGIVSGGTSINNNGNATVFVGTGTLTAIQGFVQLNNVNGSDTIFIDDSEDSTGQTFGLINFPGVAPEGAAALGQVFGTWGTANEGFITWDNATTTGVTLIGGSLGNTFNIFETGTAPITIDGGSGANTFNVNPFGTQQSLGANILGALTLHGGGNSGTVLNLLERNDPSSETFNFAISQLGTGSLTLGSNPLFNLAFDGMDGGVNLATNGFSTVIDPSFTVNVIS